jgi:hypothetical protein
MFRALSITALLTVILSGSVPDGRIFNCQICEPPPNHCQDPDETLFYASFGDVAAPCGSACCIETGPFDICDDLIPCMGLHDDFDFDSIDDFAGTVRSMSGEAMGELIAEHADRVAYHSPRHALLLKGCSGQLLALLPITETQRFALEAALP